jgi:hypothetical protein
VPANQGQSLEFKSQYYHHQKKKKNILTTLNLGMEHSLMVEHSPWFQSPAMQKKKV